MHVRLLPLFALRRIMPLPDFPTITPEALAVIAERHQASHVRELPELGMFNGIFALGDDFILRVPRDNPFPISKTYKEQVAVVAARAAGVRTPAIITFDDSLELIAAPYAVYERVRGETLETLGLEADQTPEVWRELGRDFARLHHGVTKTGAVGEIEAPDYPDPRKLADELAKKGYFTKLEARWLQGWLERLAPAVQRPITKRFLHGDPQGTNVMVGSTWSYLAVLDWGSAKWGDPAWDFVNVPFSAVPFMLEGYREVAPLLGDEDGTAEARILWRTLGSALDSVAGPPLPKRSWAERPLSVLLTLVRFLLSSDQPAWLQWLPKN